VLQALQAKAPAVSITAHRYPKGYHMLLRDLDAAIVWKDVVAFVEPPLTASPSPH
jgi:alpha-beta hydrolase superfamily lysophospholipase